MFIHLSSKCLHDGRGEKLLCCKIVQLACILHMAHLEIAF